MTIRVGVLGACGKVGTAIWSAVAEADGMAPVAAVDPAGAGASLTTAAGDVEIVGDIAELRGEDVDVVIDFTVAAASRTSLAWCAEHGVHAVVGTTGFTDEDLQRFAETFDRSWCLIAPNFAIGAVLMMRFAELAAPHFDTGEVLEFHHDTKRDAPSGTAMKTVERMAAASSDWGDDPTEDHVLAGARGGEGPAGIRVHSVRMRGAIANQEVILGTTGQTLTIRHDTSDRTSFVPGVLLAVRSAEGRTGLDIGLDGLLGL